jgi:hypothetical protein
LALKRNEHLQGLILQLYRLATDPVFQRPGVDLTPAQRKSRVFRKVYCIGIGRNPMSHTAPRKPYTQANLSGSKSTFQLAGPNEKGRPFPSGPWLVS